MVGLARSDVRLLARHHGSVPRTQGGADRATGDTVACIEEVVADPQFRALLDGELNAELCQHR